MSVLDPYHKPSKEELAEMSREEVEALDEKNQALQQENTRLTEAAKAVALEVDPTNKKIRDIQYPPPVKLRAVWDKIQDAKKKAEQA